MLRDNKVRAAKNHGRKFRNELVSWPLFQWNRPTRNTWKKIKVKVEEHLVEMAGKPGRLALNYILCYTKNRGRSVKILVNFFCFYFKILFISFLPISVYFSVILYLLFWIFLTELSMSGEFHLFPENNHAG